MHLENEKTVVDDDDCGSDIISEHIGHSGRYQLFWAGILSTIQIVPTLHMMAIVFQAIPRNHWCARPDDMMDTPVDKWMNMTSQTNNSCEMTADYNLTSFQLGRQKCSRYEFANEMMSDTIISEFNLVCDREYLYPLVEASFLVGAAIGAVVSGWISDRFGRKNLLMSLLTIQLSLGTVAVFANSVEIFMLLRFLIGFSSMGVTMVSFVLAVEMVSGRARTVVGILVFLFYPIGYILMAGIAYYAQNWKIIQLVISAPFLLYLIFWYWMPESPRWLLENNKKEKLSKIIEIAAKWNKRELIPNYVDTLTPSNMNHANASILSLFNREFFLTTVLTFISWLTFIVVYIGLLLHLNNLGGNIYLTTIIGSVLEGISVILSIFVVRKLGLRANLIAYMLISGVACLLVNFFNEDKLIAVISLAMIVKCTIGATNALVPTLTSDMYPTTMRNMGIGVGNFAAGIGLILIPFIWSLEKIYRHLPMTLMGIGAFLGAIAIFFSRVKTKSSSTPPSTLSKIKITANEVGGFSNKNFKTRF